MVVGRAAACPLHNWLTSLETESALGADSGCTQTLPLRVVGDRVELDVSALRTEKLHAV
jgi:nitrite reductase (NADH) small subunit